MKNPYIESEQKNEIMSSFIVSDQGKRPSGQNSGRRNDINKTYKTTELQRDTFDTSPDLQFYQDTVVASRDPKTVNRERFRQSWQPEASQLPSQLIRPAPQFPNVMSEQRVGMKNRVKVNEEPVKPFMQGYA